MRKLLLSLLLLCGVSLYAQVTTVPVFITKGYSDTIIINFNPNEGNKGMAQATQCYAHTGLITSESKSKSDWKYAPTWRSGLEKHKMTKVGDVWQLIIPNIYTYYGCPESIEILSMAFVFNDGKGGSLEGKTASYTDIFVDLVNADDFLTTLQPSANQIVNIGEEFVLKGFSSQAASLRFTINGALVAEGQGTELELKHIFEQTGVYDIEFAATNGDKTVSSYLSVTAVRATNEAKRPEGLQTGITYNSETSVTLCLYAGSKTEPARNVFVVGEFNNWQIKPEYQMYRDGFYFWLTIDNLMPGHEYAFQYKVIRADGVIKNISDPYSTKLLHPDDKYEPKTVDKTLKSYPNNSEADGYVTVINTRPTKYEWSDATLNFRRPDKNNLVIYELWIYDYTPSRSIAGLMDMLDYIQSLGVNAIELMPICEFDGNYNWGYSPNHYFAPDKAYGSETDYKKLIDECHKRGMAVIIDMVFNHGTGLNPQNKLYPYGADLAQNPYFNVIAPHSDNVYEDWNHDFPLTREMFTRALNYWIQEFHVDGYRMDLSHGFCGENCNSLMDNISHYYNNGVLAAEDYSAKGEPYFILEHWGSGMASERPKLVSQGMMCWSNTSNAYSQLAMGWPSDNNLTDANKKGYVSYCESHDEERNFYKVKMYGNGSPKTNYKTEGLSRIPITRAFSVLLQGPQMMYQYAELGYDYSINSTKGSSTISENNRTSIKEQPISLGWLEDSTRMAAYDEIAKVILLRTKLRPDIFTNGSIGNVKIQSGMVRSFSWTLGTERIIVVGNFNVEEPDNAASTYVAEQTVKPFTLAGVWYDYLNQEKLTATQNTEIILEPGEYRIFTNFQLDLPTVGVDLVSEQTAHVFPTVTTDRVRIDMPDMEAVSVVVYNLQGQQCGMFDKVNEISLAHLSAGMYMLQIASSHGIENVRVIKK